ncbi:MAG: hypothetical protein FJ125_14220, partial [Deltaproteobacteria bacterium]|nr:hypothetical protein [Deltaproteobacteria bacterium]
SGGGGGGDQPGGGGGDQPGGGGGGDQPGGGGGGDQPGGGGGGDPDKDYEIRVVVQWRDGTPVASASYEVLAGGQGIAAGSTGGDGRIDKGVDPGSYDVRLTAVPGFSGGGTPGDDQGTAGDPPAGDDTPPDKRAQGLKLHPVRQKALDIARTYIGKISENPGPDGNKVGWQLLKDIYDTSYGFDIFKDPSAKEKIPKPYAKYNSWCGIFATACCKKAGITSAKWEVGTGGWGPTGLASAQQEGAGYEPGDMLVMQGGLTHHCLYVRTEGSMLHTIDGNLTGQTVAERSTQPVNQLWYWYKTHPEVYVPADQPAPPPATQGSLPSRMVTAVLKSSTAPPEVLVLDADPPPAPPGGPPTTPPTVPPGAPPVEEHDVYIEVVAEKSGAPRGNVRYELTLPDGKVEKGTTGPDGVIQQKGLAQAGECKLVLPDIDAKEAGK